MAVPDTFRAAMESAGAELEATQATATPSTDGAASTSTTTPGTTPDPATAGRSEEPAVDVKGLIGVPEERPDPLASTPDGKWRLDESLTPEKVVAFTPDGKPVTAAEMQDGLMLKADHTRKTQEMAEFRRSAEPAVKFVQDNMGILEDLSSGDVARQLAAFSEIAKVNDIDLGKLFQASPGGPGRDSQGRFVPAGKQATDGMLNPDDYDDDAKDLVLAYNAQAGVIQNLESKFEKFLGGVQSQQQQAETESLLNQTAQEWKGKGFEKVDIAGASQLVGTSMTPDQAMLVHHFTEIMRHNLANHKPAAPAHEGAPPTGNRPPVDMAGMSFKDAMQQATTR